MADFFERLMMGALDLDEKLRTGKLKKIPTDRLNARRNEMERKYEIQDEGNKRFGQGMTVKEMQDYNDIIAELGRRKEPRPGYISSRDKFGEKPNIIGIIE